MGQPVSSEIWDLRCLQSAVGACLCAAAFPFQKSNKKATRRALRIESHSSDTQLFLFPCEEHPFVVLMGCFACCSSSLRSPCLGQFPLDLLLRIAAPFLFEAASWRLWRGRSRLRLCFAATQHSLDQSARICKGNRSRVHRSCRLLEMAICPCKRRSSSKRGCCFAYLEAKHGKTPMLSSSVRDEHTRGREKKRMVGP